MNEITYKKQMIKEMNQLHAEHGLEKPEKAQKSPVKPRKARSPKRPKARKPQSSKAQILTSKPDPKAQEPSPARNNNSHGPRGLRTRVGVLYKILQDASREFHGFTHFSLRL